MTHFCDFGTITGALTGLVCAPQPPPSVWSDPRQQRLRGQAGRQGGGEGEGRGRGRAVDPGRGRQLQPFHQQVRADGHVFGCGRGFNGVERSNYFLIH